MFYITSTSKFKLRIVIKTAREGGEIVAKYNVKLGAIINVINEYTLYPVENLMKTEYYFGNVS